MQTTQEVSYLNKKQYFGIRRHFNDPLRHCSFSVDRVIVRSINKSRAEYRYTKPLHWVDDAELIWYIFIGL